MIKHSFLIRYLFATVLAGLIWLGAGLAPSSVLVADRGQVTILATNSSQAADVLKGADVIILGEVHDNARHHQIQADLIAALQPAAIVWEMITQSQAEGLRPEILRNSDDTAAALNWQTSGWPEFALYAPVFEASELSSHFGALVPRSVSRAALDQGVASHFGADAARFGLDQPLQDAEQAEREADQMANHCNAMPKEILPMMVDLQRLRDASLAAAAERALQQTGGPVVVITGNGHARLDRGLSVYLDRAMPGIEIRALGQMEDGAGQGRFDVVLNSPAMQRADPCLAFSKSE